MTENLPEVRVGDRERRAVDSRLRAALDDGVLTLAEYDERAGDCWAARTRGELDALVRDLPEDGAAAVQVPRHGTVRRVTAVLSQDELALPVQPGDPVVATAVMGTAEVDLRREDLPSEVHVTATAVMGEVKVRVPPGTSVRLSGGAVMGERKVRTGAPAADGPVVHVHARALMGTVKVDDRPRKGGLLPASPSAAGGHRPAGHLVRHRGTGALGAVAAATVVAAGLYGVGQVVTADDGASVFGSRVVVVDDKASQVEVGVLFGSVQVVVPDGTQVRTEGTTAFGSVDCVEACTSPSERVVVVRGNGAFGSIEIVTQTEAQRQR